MVHAARRLLSHWPMVFAVTVFGWFALTAIGLTKDLPDFSSPPSPSSPFTSSSQNEPSATQVPAGSAPENTTAGALEIKVVSFRISATSAISANKSTGVMSANFMLEIRNNATSNEKFLPAQLTLMTGKGEPVTPSIPGNKPITISPHISQLTPATFEILPRAGATYSLIYRGHTLYTGTPH